MLKKIFKSEDKRRIVNPSFDTFPTYGHIFNVEFSKKYIKDKRVLDVGCWTGQFEQLAQSFAAEIMGIDPNIDAIKFAKKTLPKVKFLVGYADKLPFPDYYFDTVVFFDVIEHLPKNTEDKVLREISRVIKPEGILILSTGYKQFLSILFDPAYFLIDHRHYSVKEISNLLKDAKFKINRVYLAGNIIGLLLALFSYFCKYTIGFEPSYSQKMQNFFLKEYRKPGYTNIYVVAKSIKLSI